MSSEHRCGPGCSHGHHDAEAVGQFTEARRGFMKDVLVSGTALSLGAFGSSAHAASSFAGGGPVRTEKALATHYHIPATADTVHWGYFSKSLKPTVELESGDFATIETLTHHCGDDVERMIKGDPGAESVFRWDANGKAVDRRGAGPMDHPLGAGGGQGVHICTGPIAIRGAEPGDVLEVRILDVWPRESGNPQFKGRTFGSNAAANWGFHYGDLIEEPVKREVITIYEVDARGERNWARAAYSYRWTPQTDPSGRVHATIDYPGVLVDPSTIRPQ